ncbi:PEP-CTERM sorting domain-containing protein [Marinobacter sp. AN1]|uniref:PEP-CTERM sorting domain-containing protein n=1 Tax=Marinobacter sp. AN1 TaxID=2886046 RepID=UPI00223175F9|nr:PEP-CTERM sorting domain-containing protein [Marinobacter sp. AN1]UZD66472.1 PEP-CTERM sorting domain-containing protein [Marinobacter sp. AN1]
MMIRKMTGLGAAIAILTSGSAAASFIDFEDANARSLLDNDAITNEYQGTNGVVFSGGFIEASGGDDANPQGFITDQVSSPDVDLSNGTPGLGNWFVRTEGEIGQRGSGSIFLSIFYDGIVTGASGEIWDIDGNTGQGTEKWNVVALNNGSEVLSVASPEGFNNGTLSRDGLPWFFELNGAVFDQINFEFAGTKEFGVGLGFDNFTSSVPEPGTLGLLGLGLLGLGAARRRFSV